VRHRPPGVEQFGPAHSASSFAFVHDAHRGGRPAADALRAVGQVVAVDQVGERGAILGRDLHDRAEFLVEQRARRRCRPAVEVSSRPRCASERHLAQRGERAAVGAVVVGEQQPSARARCTSRTGDAGAAGSSRSGQAPPKAP
jgi:hypothetical protein